jgi:hypothetical protein
MSLSYRQHNMLSEDGAQHFNAKLRPEIERARVEGWRNRSRGHNTTPGGSWLDIVKYIHPNPKLLITISVLIMIILPNIVRAYLCRS